MDASRKGRPVLNGGVKGKNNKKYLRLSCKAHIKNDKTWLE